ncbi:MAG: hypothetical protein K2X71_15670 [Methylobacterium sp.]|nr:hypothetical protein [Methylobacterium sp.]MBY0297453.1 hypothetical protein [Methylobacterium sp.]
MNAFKRAREREDRFEKEAAWLLERLATVEAARGAGRGGETSHAQE